jgi:hypothetical protein
MKPQPDTSTREVSTGLVERVTYHYEETGPQGRNGNELYKDLPRSGMHSVALAGSVTQPGSTLGTAPGAPLSEGFYFSNTPDWGVRDPSTRLFVDIRCTPGRRRG